MCLCLVAWGAIGCDGSNGASSAPAAGTGAIVSTSPAAAELLVAMGLRARIAGATGYEADPELKKLPKVGDYLSVDWERMAAIKPSLLIVQGKRDRLPPGVRERAEAMGIKVLVLQIDRFADILSEIDRIGEAAGAREAAATLRAKMESDLAAIRTAAEARGPKISTLLVLSENGMFVAGRDNYLNDVLDAAGGQNVITAEGYVTLDGEKLRSLRPQSVIVLIPNATPEMIESAKKQLKDLEAVQAGRVHAITSADALLPGAGTVAIARSISDHFQSTAAMPAGVASQPGAGQSP